MVAIINRNILNVRTAYRLYFTIHVVETRYMVSYGVNTGGDAVKGTSPNECCVKGCEIAFS